MKRPDARLAASTARRYRKYPEYRNSETDWLAQIPAHWKLHRIAQEFRIENGATPKTSDPMLWSGDIPWVTPDDLGSLQSAELCVTQRYITTEGYNSCGVSLVPPGSLVLSTRAPIGHLAIAGVPLCTNQGCRSLVFRNAVVQKYFYYQILVARPELESWGQGSTFKELSASKLRSLLIVTPPIPEQKAIADFLDRETVKIDALVEKKKQLIELLQVRRAALIADAISQGSVSTEVRLGHYADILPGFAFPSEAFSHDPDDVRLLRGVNISPDSLRWDEVVNWPKQDLAKFSRYQLQNGDIVLGMDRPWIGSGLRLSLVTASDLPALLLQRVARLRAKYGLAQQYLRLMLAGPQFRSYFEPILTGISVPHISPDQIASFKFKLPSLARQAAICQKLETDMVKIKTLIDTLTTSTDLLKILRTALISAAVTGKIDVRGEVA